MILKRAIRVLTNKPTKIKGPLFTKEFVNEDKQIEALENLLLTANERSKSFIENDIKRLKYGVIGEKNIYYELKNSFTSMVCLHNVRIEYNGLVAQIDFIVITSKKIYVIECKNLIGDISVSSEGEFIRYKKNSYGKVVSKEGIYSPIAQNERHINILKELLRDKLEYNHKLKRIESLVVIANPKTVINKKYAPKDISNKIIRHDQLIDTIKIAEKDKKTEWVFIEEDMMNISNCLMKYHKDIQIDYINKYSLNQDSKVEYTEEISVDNKDTSTDEKIRCNLKEYRLKTSNAENIKPYMVFSNDTMEEIIITKPKNTDELREIKGFGPVKCEKYGKYIIDIINS